MNRNHPLTPHLINLMVALAISAVVNFSSMLLIFSDPTGETIHSFRERVTLTECRGRVSLHPNGHGFLISRNGDSVYIAQNRVRRCALKSGDRVVGEAYASKRQGAYPALLDITKLNGAEFDHSNLFQRPPAGLELSIQMLFYMILSFVLITLFTSSKRHTTLGRFARNAVLGLVITAGCYFLAPVSNWHTGRILPHMINNHMPDYVLILKCSFAGVVSILYGWIYMLISQRQDIVLENEQLKNENLTTRYNMLVGQINPHFFFNSLNSLAMLVREKQDDKALTYIDQLSYTFRYIIQNGQNTLLTLGEELKFAEAYGYLFKIRYAEKIFFDIEVDPHLREWLLPALSLQPLIGNAVKHNAITRANPLHISIRTEGEMLIVSNRKAPKLTPEPSTGIGLENLGNRWQLITGCRIEICDTQEEFTVKMPLKRPAKP